LLINRRENSQILVDLVFRLNTSTFGKYVFLIMATDRDLGSPKAFKAMGKVEEWNVA
jgi:hypothetical protein